MSISRLRSSNTYVTELGPAFDVVYSNHTDHYPDCSLTAPFISIHGIRDVVGNYGFNPVDHVTGESFVRGLTDFRQPDGGFVHWLGECLPYLPDLGAPNGDGLIPTFSPATLSAWSSEAFNDFTDQVPEEFSLANFLYELRDIKGMIPKIEKSLSKTASSNFLAFEFGVKPFLGDVQKLANILSTVEKRLKHLRATAGKEVSLRFKRKMEKPSNVNFTRKGHDFNNGVGCNLDFELVGYTGEFNVTAKLFQNLEGLNEPMSMMKGLAAATGFNNPAAIVWEAIPYSFVVDWLFRLDKQIDKLAIQPFGGEYALRDVGYSTNESFLWEVYQNFFPQMGNPRVSIGQISCKYFRRRNGFPLSSLFVTDWTLTPKQLVLSLALLNQLR